MFIIVDSNFLIDDKEGKWVFGHSHTPNELWPNILEKAYAKLYGGYSNIISGKVSYALSDLTGGYPEELNLEHAQKNLTSFWEKIHSYHKAGYLLGAGSPPNSRGDAAISRDGIV